jgi:hypothetical protein
VVRFVHHARLIEWVAMKSVNFASVLFIAAALGLWACQQSGAAERLSEALDHSVARTATR